MQDLDRVRQFLFFAADAHDGTTRAARALIVNGELGDVTVRDVRAYAQALHRESRTVETLRDAHRSVRKTGARTT